MEAEIPPSSTNNSLELAPQINLDIPPVVPSAGNLETPASPDFEALPEPPTTSSTPDARYPTYRPALGRFRNENEPLPEPPPMLIEDPPTLETPPAPQIRQVILRVRPEPDLFTTPCDSFGRYRVYPAKPHFIPDSACELGDFSETDRNLDQSGVTSLNLGTPSSSLSDIIAPCPNILTFRLQHWHWNEGNKKSESSRESLVQNVLLQPDFKISDVANVSSWHRLDDSLANYSADSGPTRARFSVPLATPPRTPATAIRYKANPTENLLPVWSVKSNTMLDALHTAFTKNDPRFFHYVPYEARCRDPRTSKDYRTYGEVYESQRMLDHHRALQELVLEEPCNLPRCAAEIMVFSDATQLADFGNAKAWPIRVTFGNLSKQERCKPNPKNHFEIAFFPSLPANIQDQLRKLEPGRPIPKTLLTHLRRELFHEVLKHILDDSFLRAWRHGVVIKCADGVTRRVFPRIFSYSADYPEKVLLATIRGMKSLRPCPRCLMPKSEFQNLGLASDFRRRLKLRRIDDQARSDLVRQARSIIYDEGRATTAKRVEILLKPHSYVPVNNAFSARLRFLGFDVFETLTVDFLHEFELGVWKAVFNHLLRVLHSKRPHSVAILNERFRLIPSFGTDGIRPFSEDVSDMTRPAARNYEDILQAYATVDILRLTTTRLGYELREFKRYTSELEVYETPKERSARQQRARKKAKPRAALLTEDAAEPDPTLELERRRKDFNLETIKTHSLGDYPETVVSVGTTDSFSTQTGELLHRHSKQRYVRTNGRDYLPQMARIQQIETRLSDIKTNLDAATSAAPPDTKAPTTAPALVHEDLPIDESGYSPYQIAMSQKNPLPLPIWLKKHASDPAFEYFLPRLRSHLIARISGGRYQDELDHDTSDISDIQFQYERIYAHQTLRLHYTTYNVRRDQDTVNPSTAKRFIVLRSDEPDSPGMGARRFWYAKVLGVYHANVIYKGASPKRMDFLWVRWLSRMADVPGGWETCRLDRLGYFKDSEEFHAFDFVDPADVIRGVHLIPRFVGEQTGEYLESIDSISADMKGVGDWKNYYVSRFADRDMLMRFTGMAIGHTTLSSVPGYTSGVPEQALESEYQYSDDEENESGNNEDGDTHNTNLDLESDEAEDGEQTDESGSDGGQTDNEVDGVADDDVEGTRKEAKRLEKAAEFSAKSARAPPAANSAPPSEKKKPANEKKTKAGEVPSVNNAPPGEKKDLSEPMAAGYSPIAVESAWYEWRNKEGYFKPQTGSDGKPKPEGQFVLPCPLPNVTGSLHIGHGLMVAIQDSLIRWYRMLGKTTLFVPGHDHAGISTQSVVEKRLYKVTGQTRHDLGREKFLETVWDWKHDYQGRITKQMERLGGSYDWTRVAFTMDENLSRAVSETFCRLHEDGILCRANRLVNWCVKLNTTLSNLEVDQKQLNGRTLLNVPGYDEKERFEFGVITSFAYPIEGSDEKIIVATTRPETMLGDTAVAIHPDDPRHKHLHGKFASHPLLPNRRIPIVTDSIAVDMEFGTGAVKITPAHDPNDYEVGVRHNLEFINILSDDGTFNSNAGEKFKGMKRFHARRAVVEALKELGLKSGDIIEPVMKPQWWVNCQPLAEEAIKRTRAGELLISPKTSEAEWYRWLEGIQDWGLTKTKMMGNAKFTIHQDEDVLDTWFLSGLWPFSIMGWPKEVARMVLLGIKLTGKMPFKEVFCHAMVRDAHGRKMSKSLGNVIDPVDVIEGITLERLQQKLTEGNFDEREILKAQAGQKKDFPKGIPQCGTDALRFALCAYTSEGRDINLEILRVEGYRKFCNKLWNATKFAMLKLDDAFVPEASPKPTGRETIVEKWILHKLDIAAADTNKALEERNFMVATTAVYNLWLYELCDVFIEAMKPMTDEGASADVRKSAQNTLYTCLDSGLWLLHPFMPFVTEELWQRLPRRPNDPTPSIMVSKYPVQ
ncbi:hypothetical protein FRC07_014709, partial [Ceratobasidium sp. 392]